MHAAGDNPTCAKAPGSSATQTAFANETDPTGNAEKSVSGQTKTANPSDQADLHRWTGDARRQMRVPASSPAMDRLTMRPGGTLMRSSEAGLRPFRLDAASVRACYRVAL